MPHPLRRRALLGAVPALASLAGPPARADTPAQALQRARRLRDEAVQAGDQAYGAVVLLDGRIVGEGPSRVVQRQDATAHAEMEALRDAARRLGPRGLAGAVLVSTSRPCAMCEAAAARAGIARMLHAGHAGDAIVDAGAPGGAPGGGAGGTSALALHRAATQGDLATLRRLLDAGTPVDVRDAQGRTALLLATHADQPQAARLLIERGADVNAQDAIADSPYLLAGARGRLEILRLTLAAGADLRSVNRYGGTALIPAAHYGHVEVVRELLKTAIDVDHVNRLGWTALLEAILLGDGGPAHTEIVRLLLAAGARPERADGQGVTPLAHARARGQNAIVALLVQAGARR
jgi:hypothetical protein